MDEKKGPVAFEAARLREVFGLLQKAGYRIAGPYVQNEAIGFGFLDNFEQIPIGYSDTQNPGRYQLQHGTGSGFFQYAVGPHSIKTVLHPARRKLWQATKVQGEGIDFQEDPLPDKPIAIFGVRACDIKSLDVLDQVFLEAGYIDPHYVAMRTRLFIVGVSCSEPGNLCFCSSMGYGPEPEHADLHLTEILTEQRHYFLAAAGTAQGQHILDDLQAPPAEPDMIQAGIEGIEQAHRKIKKTLNTQNLPEILKNNPLHARWDEVADRCLSCGNCTMVCPTCFCTTTEDITDLRGEHTERWLQWDSCFNLDFSYIHGGSVRKSTASRYRQWLTHKLSTWFDQFGSSGCVGCGRCIAWCPVGIDLTEEAHAIRGSP